MKNVVHLTPAAAEHIKHLLHNKPEALGLRLGVKSYGCSGLGYVVDYANESSNQDDHIFTMEGLSLFIDQKSLPYLEGLVVDCVSEGLNRTLKFINPNATGSCGCGESFSTNQQE